MTSRILSLDSYDIRFPTSRQRMATYLYPSGPAWRQDG